MADQILNLNGKQAAAGSGVINIVPADYISGLKMVWVSATALTVTTGTACRPSDSLLMAPAANIAKTALALTASTWYHVYLYMNGANPDIEIVTTAPAAAYIGTARAKTGDTTRRYIGSILTDASGNIYPFGHTGNRVTYLTNIAPAPFLVLNAGRAITSTNVSCSAIVPVTSQSASLLILNSDGAQTVVFSNPSIGAASNTNYLLFVFNPGTSLLDLALDSSQNFNYAYPATPSGACFVRVAGYVYER